MCKWLDPKIIHLHIDENDKNKVKLFVDYLRKME